MICHWKYRNVSVYARAAKLYTTTYLRWNFIEKKKKGGNGFTFRAKTHCKKNVKVLSALVKGYAYTPEACIFIQITCIGMLEVGTILPDKFPNCGSYYVSLVYAVPGFCGPRRHAFDISVTYGILENRIRKTQQCYRRVNIDRKALS